MKLELEGSSYAIAQIGVSIGPILLQFITFPVFFANREFREWICYRLMLANGCFDLFQLLPNFLFQILYLSGVSYGQILDKVCGASFTIAWDCLVFCQLLLAGNRLLAVWKSIYSPTATDYTPRSETIIFNTLLTFVCAYFLSMVALLCTSLVGTKFQIDAPSLQFFFDFDLPYSELYQSIELWTTSLPAAICVIIYSTIVVLLKKNRMPGLVEATDVEMVGPLTKQEFRLLLQSAILFLGMLFLTLDWYLGSWWWLPDSLYKIHLTTLFFLAYCGLNPLFLITLNGHFRTELKSFYGRLFRKIFPISKKKIVTIQVVKAPKIIVGAKIPATAVEPLASSKNSSQRNLLKGVFRSTQRGSYGEENHVK